MTEPQQNKATDAAHYGSGCRKPSLRTRFSHGRSIATASGRAAPMVAAKLSTLPIKYPADNGSFNARIHRGQRFHWWQRTDNLDEFKFSSLCLLKI